MPQLRDMDVPDVLISGHHAEIAKWRRREAIRKTFENRADLLDRASLTDEERDFVRELRQNQASNEAAQRGHGRADDDRRNSNELD